MLRFIGRHWFLVALVSALAVGTTAAPSLAWFTELTVVHQWIVATVMFLTTLPVNLDTIKSTMTRPGPALLAVVIAYGLIPFMMWPVASRFSPEFGLGLMVAAVAPTTLATAAVWTRRAGGNDVIPVIVTMITNLTCFLVAPAWLNLTVDGMSQIDLPLGPTISKLFLLLVVPIFLSQAVRRLPGVPEWTVKNRQPVSVACLVGILAIVLVGAIQCGLRLRDGSIGRTWHRARHRDRSARGRRAACGTRARPPRCRR